MSLYSLKTLNCNCAKFNLIPHYYQIRTIQLHDNIRIHDFSVQCTTISPRGYHPPSSRYFGLTNIHINQIYVPK